MELPRRRTELSVYCAQSMSRRLLLYFSSLCSRYCLAKAVEALTNLLKKRLRVQRVHPAITVLV